MRCRRQCIWSFRLNLRISPRKMVQSGNFRPTHAQHRHHQLPMGCLRPMFRAVSLYYLAEMGGRIPMSLDCTLSHDCSA